MSSVFKSLARHILPRRFHASSFFPAYLRQLVIDRTRATVASGPFAGVKYVDESHGSAYEPKLLGIYESELHSAIGEAIQHDFKLIIDIGAAEGYYAVGLAKQLPNAHVIAFEQDVAGRTLMSHLAAENGVSERLTIQGECTLNSLKVAVGSGRDVLLICDVEGAEEHLLDLTAIPDLRACYMLVELHKTAAPGIVETLQQRFATSHTIEEIPQQPRHTCDFPYRTPLTAICPKAYIDNALSEFRQPWEEWMSWFWMKPKSYKHVD